MSDSTSETVLLFSGGRDSSLAACLLAVKGVRVHLLTCDNGVSLGKELSEYRFKELNAARAFTLKLKARARELAESKVDEWIGADVRKLKVRHGSVEEKDAREQTLKVLKKKFLNELGDEVFELLWEGK